MLSVLASVIHPVDLIERGSEIEVYRSVDSNVTVTPIDWNEILEDEKSDANIQLLPGDRVFVSLRGANESKTPERAEPGIRRPKKFRQRRIIQSVATKHSPLKGRTATYSSGCRSE